ncbi:MAG: LPS export ABC transporter periplasmic protein LptC [Victivallales bacterium]|nr:LPS export ABC transporter periplasmic protein LptC [Victivallales bacterium]
MSIVKWSRYILLLGILASSLFAAENKLFKGELKVESFHTQGMEKDGKIAWELEGETADLHGKVIELSLITARITQENGRDARLKSTSCRFLQSLKEVKSDAPLELVAPGVLATGIGYDIYLDKKIVRIRSTVRIVLQRQALEETRKKIEEEREQHAKGKVKE